MQQHINAGAVAADSRQPAERTERRSGYRPAELTADEMHDAERTARYYDAIPLGTARQMRWAARRCDRALPHAFRELRAMLAADATEADGRRLVAELDAYVTELWTGNAVRAVEDWDAVETPADGDEDTARELVRQAERSGDPVEKLRAWDRFASACARLTGLYAEGVTIAHRNKRRALAEADARDTARRNFHIAAGAR